MNTNAANLTDYLRRIGFEGNARPDLDTLMALHRAHVRNVTFENLDVQLRRPVVLDHDTCFDKIVRRRRGGWCFELNGVLGWALQEIGFDAVRLCGGVRREHLGDAQLGNHLCLMVRLDQRYLVDVGCGSSLSQPIPLNTGEHDHAPYVVSLIPLHDGYWRFVERAKGGGEPFSFDFLTDPADESLFVGHCAGLQTHENSPFVQNLVAQRRIDDRHLALRGRVLTSRQGTTEHKRLLTSADDLLATLRGDFDLDVPDAAALWPSICARHEALFAES